MSATTMPRTAALLRALTHARDPAMAADLMFLEAWEIEPPPGLGPTLRAHQLRRANPILVAEIQAELAAFKHPRPPAD